MCMGLTWGVYVSIWFRFGSYRICVFDFRGLLGRCLWDFVELVVALFLQGCPLGGLWDCRWVYIDFNGVYTGLLVGLLGDV